MSQGVNIQRTSGGSITEELPDDLEYFTLVFKGNLRNFQGNPLRTETPFGIPVAGGLGNALDKADDWRDELEAMIEEHRS